MVKANGQADHLEGYAWEYNLVDSKEVNAWCMPGGKIVFIQESYQSVKTMLVSLCCNGARSSSMHLAKSWSTTNEVLDFTTVRQL